MSCDNGFLQESNEVHGIHFYWPTSASYSNSQVYRYTGFEKPATKVSFSTDDVKM